MQNKQIVVFMVGAGSFYSLLSAFPSVWVIFLALFFVALCSQPLSFLRVLLLLESLALCSIVAASSPLVVSVFVTLMVTSVGEAVMGLSLLASAVRKADFLSGRAKF